MPTAISLTNLGTIPARQDILAAKLGVLGESWNPAQHTAGSTLATQSVFGAAVGLRNGDLVTGLGCLVTVAAVGTTPTTCRLGLADSTGKILAITANVNAAASWALGYSTFALSSNYTVLADGLFFVCVVKNGVFGTTEPQIATATGVDASGSLAYASQLQRGFVWTGQTDLPAVAASLTITTGTTLNRYLAALGTPVS